jgi:hypothetical protein
METYAMIEEIDELRDSYSQEEREWMRRKCWKQVVDLEATAKYCQAESAEGEHALAELAEHRRQMLSAIERSLEPIG